MKLLFKKVLLLMFSVCVCLFVLEIFCAFYLENKAVSLLKDSENELPINFQNRVWSGVDDRAWTGELGMVPHPYFGFTVRRSQSEPTKFSNVLAGGFEKYNILFRSTNRRKLVIGVIGASAADQFALFEFKTEKLRKALKKNIPQLQNAEIEIINFAVPAFKQPQQINILSLYAGSVDMIIGLDGSNDTSYQLYPDFPFYFPMNTMSHVFFGKGQMPLTYVKIIFLLELQKKLKEITKYNSHLLKTLNLIFFRIFSNLIFKYEHSIQKEAADNKKYFYNENEKESWQQRSDFYLRMIKYQSVLLAAESIPGFFFFQPMAYLPKSKPFTEIETNFLKPERATDSFEKEKIESVLYVKKQIDQKKTDLIDLTDIFLSVRETVYTDGCCHLNEAGHHILSDHIIEHILKSPSKLGLFLQRHKNPELKAFFLRDPIEYSEDGHTRWLPMAMGARPRGF